MSDMSNSIFSPFQLGNITLRNRFIKAATYEGMTPGGIPDENLIRFHRDIAAGGIAMTTLAYCGVHPDGRTFADQMVMSDAIAGPLSKLIGAVHAEGALISGQMAHCGGFSRNKPIRSKRPLGPSFRFNEYGVFVGMPFSGTMKSSDMENTLDDYYKAGLFMKNIGFDAIELHMGHGYLLSQFLSPAWNKRNDEYGGSLENRMRFPMEVFDRVRCAVGKDFPILIKMNLDDGFKGGLTLDESIVIAKTLESKGADALILSGGTTAKTPMYLFRGESPLKDMIEVEKNQGQKIALRLFGSFIVKSMRYSPLFFMESSAKIRAAVKIPLVYLGGVSEREDAEKAIAQGFEMVQVGRALIKDPAMVAHMQADPAYLNGCNHCNICVATMDTKDGVFCVLNNN